MGILCGDYGWGVNVDYKCGLRAGLLHKDFKWGL